MSDLTPATSHPVLAYQGAATGRRYHFPKKLESADAALYGVTDVGPSLVAHTTGDNKLMAEIARRYNAYDGLIEAMEKIETRAELSAAEGNYCRGALRNIVAEVRDAVAKAKG